MYYQYPHGDEVYIVTADFQLFSPPELPAAISPPDQIVLNFYVKLRLSI